MFTKQEIFEAIDITKELARTNQLHIVHEQLDLSYFMNGGMKGYLNVGERHEVNFFGNVLLYMFSNKYNDIPTLNIDRLLSIFSEVNKLGVEQLNLNEPILVHYIYDCLYAVEHIPRAKFNYAYHAVISILFCFQESCS